jgi:hypothetical protein
VDSSFDDTQESLLLACFGVKSILVELLVGGNCRVLASYFRCLNFILKERIR